MTVGRSDGHYLANICPHVGRRILFRTMTQNPRRVVGKGPLKGDSNTCPLRRQFAILFEYKLVRNKFRYIIRKSYPQLKKIPRLQRSWYILTFWARLGSTPPEVLKVSLRREQTRVAPANEGGRRRPNSARVQLGV